MPNRGSGRRASRSFAPIDREYEQLLFAEVSRSHYPSTPVPSADGVAGSVAVAGTGPEADYWMLTAMRPLTLLLLIAGLAMTPAALPEPSPDTCRSDRALRAARFEIHPSHAFERLAASVIRDFADASGDHVFDTAGPIRSLYGSSEDEILKLFSYDDVTTPQARRYGDVVFVFLLDHKDRREAEPMQWASGYEPMTGGLIDRLIEVRWWQDGTRHLVYNDAWVRCASHSLPMADNALF